MFTDYFETKLLSTGGISRYKHEHVPDFVVEFCKNYNKKYITCYIIWEHHSATINMGFYPQGRNSAFIERSKNKSTDEETICICVDLFLYVFAQKY